MLDIKPSFTYGKKKTIRKCFGVTKTYFRDFSYGIPEKIRAVLLIYPNKGFGEFPISCSRVHLTWK